MVRFASFLPAGPQGPGAPDGLPRRRPVRVCPRRDPRNSGLKFPRRPGPGPGPRPGRAEPCQCPARLGPVGGRGAHRFPGAGLGKGCKWQSRVSGPCVRRHCCCSQLLAGPSPRCSARGEGVGRRSLVRIERVTPCVGASLGSTGMPAKRRNLQRSSAVLLLPCSAQHLRPADLDGAHQ